MLGKETRPHFFYGYVVTAAGFGVWFVGWGTFTPCFSVFYKTLLTEFGWTRAEAVLAYSLSCLVQAASTIAMGWLTDRFGPRIIVTVFGSFLGICYLLMSQINELWQFQMNYALVAGIGVSALNIPVMATAARWFYKKRALMIAIVQTGVGIGGLIFAPLAGWLILTYGWRSAYKVLGIITVAGITTSGYFLRRDPRDKGQLPDGEDVPAMCPAQPSSPGIQATGLSLREAMHTIPFWIIAGLYCCFGFCRSTFTAHIPAHVRDLGFSLVDGANVLAVLIGSSIIGRIVMGRVADRIGNLPTFIISFSITTGVLVWALVARDLWQLYVFALVFGFGWGAQAVLRFAVTSEVFGLVSLGLLMGILNFAEAGAATFGSYIAGHLFDQVGNYQPAFYMGIVISMAGIILTWWLKDTHRNEAN